MSDSETDSGNRNVTSENIEISNDLQNKIKTIGHFPLTDEDSSMSENETDTEDRSNISKPSKKKSKKEPDLKKLFSTYNKSVKIKFDLPYDTHRFLIEPLTGLPHVSRILVQRYISFIDKVRKSPKRSLQSCPG